MERADVVIAGGGFAGLALGIALRQALGSAFAIIVADPFIGRDGSGDPRASAIAAGARRLFETIGVWEAVAQEAQPILDMAVTDSRLSDKVRPVFLSFGGEVEPGEPFAHMIENRDLVAALTAKARELGIVLKSAAVTGFESTSGQVAVRFPDDTDTPARLLVAADGARSRLRELAGIPTYGWTYPQSAIVTNVAHERDHGGRSSEVLERYQRWRRFDTMMMGMATDGLNRLFSNRSDALRLVRDVGLGLVDRLAGLKHLFIREAAGVTGDVPKLLRGEAL